MNKERKDKLYKAGSIAGTGALATGYWAAARDNQIAKDYKDAVKRGNNRDAQRSRNYKTEKFHAQQKSLAEAGVPKKDWPKKRDWDKLMAQQDDYPGKGSDARKIRRRRKLGQRYNANLVHGGGLDSKKQGKRHAIRGKWVKMPDGSYKFKQGIIRRIIHAVGGKRAWLPRALTRL